MRASDAHLAAEEHVAGAAAGSGRGARSHSPATRSMRAALVIGVGLVAAPFAFQMLGGENRALKGADMMDAFAPFMRETRLTQFEGFLATIDGAEAEARTALLPAVAPTAATDGEQAAIAAVEDWSGQWRGEAGGVGIHADMSEMVDDIAANLDNYAAVRALPPFWLFPFFFIGPGLVIAGLAGAALRRSRAGLGVGMPGKALVAMGAALVAAPFTFQMMGGENRAFEGKAMIDDFRSIMTTENVTDVQGYFAPIGLAEGLLRNDLVPLAGPQAAPEYPAIHEFSEEWSTISAEFASFLGAMNDNLVGYNAVKALPPFSLFPFFFIIPGVLVAGLGAAARRGARA